MSDNEETNMSEFYRDAANALQERVEELERALASIIRMSDYGYEDTQNMQFVVIKSAAQTVYDPS